MDRGEKWENRNLAKGDAVFLVGDILFRLQNFQGNYNHLVTCLCEICMCMCLDYCSRREINHRITVYFFSLAHVPILDVP